MKAVGDRVAPARGAERPDEAPRAQPPRQEQKRFERALQRAARREEDAPEAAPDASAGPAWGRPSVAVGARDANAAPMDAGAIAMPALRPLPAAARGYLRQLLGLQPDHLQIGDHGLVLRLPVQPLAEALKDAGAA